MRRCEVGSAKPLRIGGWERRATRCGAFLNRPRDVDDDLTGCGPRPHRIIRRLARPYSRNVSAFSSGLLVPSLWRSSRSASYQNASSRPSGRPAVSHSWWARVRICSMVGTLIFGPTSLHGRSHNVGCRNLFPCEQEPPDRSRIEFQEFFFLYLHDRGGGVPTIAFRAKWYAEADDICRGWANLNWDKIVANDPASCRSLPPTVIVRLAH